MVDLDIFGAGGEVTGQREEPRMLARTVVVDLAGRFMRADEAVMGGYVVGPVRAAAQVGLGEAEAGEPCGDHAGMDRCPLMAGAGERQLRLGQAGRVGGSAFDEWQRLEHLAGGAREDHRRGVAPGRDDGTPRVADHGMAGMGAFQEAAAPQFDHRLRACQCRHRPERPPHGCAIFCPRGFRPLAVSR